MSVDKSCTTLFIHKAEMAFIIATSKVAVTLNILDINILERPGELPWWLSGKESTYQFKRHQFSPWSRKIPHAVEQPSLCATTTEPVL